MTDISNLLNNINKIYERKTNINLLIKTMQPDENLFIYTSGCADPYRYQQWKNTVLPWLKTLNIKFTVDHYDNFTDIYDLGSPGNKIKNYLWFDQKYRDQYEDSPAATNIGVSFDDLPGVKENNYVYFDFAHILNHLNLTLPYTYIYYPYEESNTNTYFDIKPFTIKNGKIETYINKLRNNEYKVIDVIGIIIDSETFNFKSIEYEGVKLDNETKFMKLLEIIRHFELSNVATDIEVEKTRLQFHKFIKFDGTPIKNALQSAKKFDKAS